MSEKVIYYDTAQIKKIQSAIEEHDFFTAIVLSAIQLERHGYHACWQYLEAKEVDSDLIRRLLDRKHLKEIADYLRILKKIDDNEHKKIMEINEERNKYVHRREVKEYLRGEDAQRIYTPLVNEAIRILKEKLDVIRAFVSRG